MECSKSIETIRTPKAKAESHPENKNNNQKKKIALLFGFSVVEKRYIEKGEKKALSRCAVILRTPGVMLLGFNTITGLIAVPKKNKAPPTIPDPDRL